MPNVVFLTGSSGVGKSSLAELLFRKHGFYIEALSARTPRALINNPNFEILEKFPHKGMAHQELVYTFFEEYIASKLAYIDNLNIDANYLFERDLIDVVGYSYAFSKQWTWHDYTAWLDFQLCSVRMFRARMKLKYTNINFFYVYVPINETVPYEAIEARPSKNIRNLCDEFIKLSDTFDIALIPSNIETYANEIVVNVSNPNIL